MKETTRRMTKAAAKDLRAENGPSQRLASEDADEVSRPRKRIFKRAGAAETARKQNRRGSLDLLPTMPLDILFEVLGHLHPRDLVNLLNVNKLFRNTLVSENLRVAWRRSRQMRGAPECPSDMEEYQWVKLLFVPECQLCGKKNIHKVDFLIRRRLCTVCRKTHLVPLSKAKNEASLVVLNNLPFTTSTNVSFRMTGNVGTGSSRRYIFWPDIEPMVTKISDFLDRKAGSTEWQAKYERYTERKQQIIREMHSTVKTNQRWLEDAYLSRHEDEHQIQRIRRDTIFRKLADLGHSASSIAPLDHHPEVLRRVALTDRMWMRIRHILEAEMEGIQQLKLAMEYEALQRRRRDIVEDLYDAYMLSLPASEWRQLPRVLDVCELPQFLSLIDSPLERTVTEEDFEDAMELLPGILSDYKTTKLAQFRSQLVASSPELTPEGPGAPDPLDLAISVFECRGDWSGGPHIDHFAIIGVDELLSHYCELPRGGLTQPRSLSRNSTAPHQPYAKIYPANSEYDRREKVYSVSSSKIARTLVALAGLDVETALSEEMDKKNLRFICKYCSSVMFGHPPEAFSYSWRTAITHARGHEVPDLPSTGWKIAPDELLPRIREHESRHVGFTGNQDGWTCRHCTVLGKNTVRRDVVIDHIKTVHGIEDPKQLHDFFFLDRSNWQYYALAADIVQ